MRIAMVDTQPEAFFHLAGREMLSVKASRGINTAVSVK